MPTRNSARARMGERRACRYGKQRVCRDWKQNMKQPVLEHSLVGGLQSQTPTHDDDVRSPHETHQAPKHSDRDDLVPGSACNR